MTQTITKPRHRKPSSLPRNYAHREAMKKLGNRSKIDKIIEKTFGEFDRRNLAIFKWKNYILKNLDSLRDKINEKMEADGTIIKSLVLIHQIKGLKCYISIRIKMKIDSRGELALQLIREFLDEYSKTITTADENVQLMVDLLSDLFTQRRKELVVTQGLLNFTRLDAYKIKDVRLREAHKLLKECISAEESGPVVSLYVRTDNKWEPYHTPEPVSKKVAK
jgi:hypothetical protein